MESQNKWGQSPLSFAAEADHEGMVEPLLNARANVEYQDKYRQSLLHRVACRSGWHVGIVKLLLSAGGNVQSQDMFGNSPLSMAKLNGDEALAQFLLNAGID